MNKKPSTRQLKEMALVVFDKEFARQNPDLELYQVYREIKKDRDLRWDITIIPPQMLGQEFVRTKGNKNSCGFQELYTVLKGNAIFLMQKSKEQSAEIVEDTFVIKAKPGDWVIVPPDYAIVTINPSSSKTLETGNWVSEKTQNIYEEIEKMQGACYFYTRSGWIKNKNYQQVAELRFEEAIKSQPESLDFLRFGIE